MVSQDQYDLVRELVDDAVARGCDSCAAAGREVDGCPGRSTPRPCSPASPTTCGSCARRSSARSCRSWRSTPRTRRSRWPTTRTSGSARRSGPRPRQGRAPRAPDRGRHGVDERPHVLPRRVLDAVGRREGLRHRPLPLELRPLRVREREARELGASGRETSGGTRTTNRSAAASTHPPSCCTAATRTSRPRCDAGSARCCGSCASRCATRLGASPGGRSPPQLRAEDYQDPEIADTGIGVVELEGLRNARVYDPATNRWQQTGSMNVGRWYPAWSRSATARCSWRAASRSS